MTIGRLYVPLDVDYADNPKMIGVGERGEVLYIRALCLAKRTLTDGFIDERQLVRFGLPGVEVRAESLVREGLWEKVPGGYQITGWLERNTSASAIHEASTKRAEAGRLGGQRSGVTRKKEADA